MEIGGPLPALLLIHFHGPQQDTAQARADDGNRGKGVVQDVRGEKGRRLVRRQFQVAID